MTMNVNKTSAQYYKSEEKINNLDYVGYDIFWEYGDYLYNLAISVRKSEERLIQRIIDSVLFEKIDRDVVGILFMDKLSEDEDAVVSTVKNSAIGFTVNVPSTWSRIAENSIFADENKGIFLFVLKIDEAVSKSDLEKSLAESAKSNDLEIIKNVTEMNRQDLASNSYTGYTLETLVTADSQKGYNIQYVIVSNNKSFLISASVNETHYSEAVKEIFAKIVKSFMID